MNVSRVLVDANVLLDVLTDDPRWFEWSASQIEKLEGEYELCINPLIYAEVSVRYDTIEALEAALPESEFNRVELPWAAGFLAGRAYLDYRRRRGVRRSPLADFYIGAHAAISGMALLTRDAARYRTYFPTVEIIEPDGGGE